MARKPVNIKDGGWSLGLNSGGYLTRVYHFYPDGERTSACYAGMRRARPPAPQHQVPEEKRCAGCRAWLAGHEDTGAVRYKRAVR